MKCPYLSSASKKECVKMLAERMDGALSDFDLKHFCDGNPIYCYYFRSRTLDSSDRLNGPTVTADVTTTEKRMFPATALKESVLKQDDRLFLGKRDQQA
jgi:hypothetical protein